MDLAKHRRGAGCCVVYCSVYGDVMTPEQLDTLRSGAPLRGMDGAEMVMLCVAHIDTQVAEIMRLRDVVVVLKRNLLWLRNHYDVGKRRLKQEVLKRIDAIIDSPFMGPEK